MSYLINQKVVKNQNFQLFKVKYLFLENTLTKFFVEEYILNEVGLNNNLRFYNKIIFSIIKSYL